MHQCQSRGVAFVLQIRIEPAQLTHQEHTLVNNGTAGQRGHVGVLHGLLELTAHHVQFPVKVNAAVHVCRALYKALTDVRHAIPGALTQNVRAGGHVAPAEEFQIFLFRDNFKQLFAAAAVQGVLGEEKHSHSVIPLAAKMQIQLLANLREKGMGNL